MLQTLSNTTHEVSLQQVDSFVGTQKFHTFNDIYLHVFSAGYVLETLIKLQEASKYWSLLEYGLTLLLCGRIHFLCIDHQLIETQYLLWICSFAMSLLDSRHCYLSGYLNYLFCLITDYRTFLHLCLFLLQLSGKLLFELSLLALFLINYFLSDQNHLHIKSFDFLLNSNLYPCLAHALFCKLSVCLWKFLGHWMRLLKRL